MKLLTLIRHAKSDWRYEGLSDFERPLNARGRRNAPQMGQHLRNFLPPLDCLVASPANRAITTARLPADELGVDKDAIVVIPALYLAAPADMLEVVKSLAAAISTSRWWATIRASASSAINWPTMPSSANCPPAPPLT